ncbi:MAG: hypothetical protein GQ583_12210 [Methyloprofundus sp.]|nr:hypothetical protein [Methyloprofundus sp.]
MKKYLFFILTALFLQACSNDKTDTTAQTKVPQITQQAADTSKPSTQEWNGSALSETTIKQVQEDKYNYKQCVYKEAQKQGYQKMDSRVATDAVIKQCEPTLAKIRTTFSSEGVPEIIIDRFLKKTRIDMTRKILQSLMFAEASRKAGATQQVRQQSPAPQ